MHRARRASGAWSQRLTPDHLSTVGLPERATQDRVVALFRDELGRRYLGDTDQSGNSNIEEGSLSMSRARVSRPWWSTR